ncbi:MAG: YchF/TatD family DNA exonuclease [Candidatus Omnitrophica bacterium]|nr:YchF/TatD family DNA exonuclease [Candidatus Omnitrophota bacterium]
MLIDCHCHLSFPDFSNDLDKVLKSLENSLYAAIESAVNLENARNAIKLFSGCNLIKFSLGFHPYYAQDFNPGVIQEYSRFIENNKRIVAIGEVGLDTKSTVAIEKQKEVFSEFMDLAKEYNLPLFIHNRGFKETILKMLKEKGLKKVVFHCFSQDKEFIKEVASCGYFASFATNITFKKADILREAIKLAPEELILTETDSPYLAPQAIRGKRNNPLYVKEGLMEIARIKNKDPNAMKEIILENAKRIFNI